MEVKLISVKNGVTLLCAVASSILLVAIIILAANMLFITVLQYWWAFLIGAIISGPAVVLQKGKEENDISRKSKVFEKI